MSEAADIAAGILEAGFMATFTRSGTQVNPWDTPGAAATFSLAVSDQGIQEQYVAGSAATRKARMLLVAANGTRPAIGDSVQIDGLAHEVLAVMPTKLRDQAIVFKVETST